MRINKKLNLVVPVEDDNGSIFYVHAKPFSREAFEANYMLFSQAFAAMIENGIQVTAGPRVAALVLKDIAVKNGKEHEYTAIIAEIKRTANLIRATEAGFEPKMLSSAIAHGDISEDDAAYVEGVICFFTLASAMWRGDRLDATLAFMNGLWGTQTESLDCTAFIASLKTTTKAEDTGAKVKA